jgi:spore germination protein GerM
MKEKNKIKSAEVVGYSFNKIFFGLFVIIFGLTSLINCTGLIYLNINYCLIWPLFIVFVGLSLFRKNDAVSTALGSTIATLCVAMVSVSFVSSIPFDYRDVSILPLDVAKESSIKKANINIDAGAGEVRVYGIDTGKLVEGEARTNLMKVKIDSQAENDVQNVNIGISEGKWFNNGNLKNEFSVGIDKGTPVDISINSGASNNFIDLSGVKAESVIIHTGASNVDLKMGEVLDSANVVVEAGMSTINFDFPKTAGVRISTESGMSSQEFPDFISIDKNTYQSLNYESSQKKINVSVKIGMSSLTVGWYEPEKKEKVYLYYYNQLEDKENTCDFKFVTPVEREITASDNIIEDTINLLIKGQLTDEEKNQGFATEYPNQEFKLLKSNLTESGTLTMEFTEVPGFTSGGSCRTGILMEEILKTVRQFPEVKKIVFKPDSLFEP